MTPRCVTSSLIRAQVSHIAPSFELRLLLWRSAARCGYNQPALSERSLSPSVETSSLRHDEQCFLLTLVLGLYDCFIGVGAPPHEVVRALTHEA